MWIKWKYNDHGHPDFKELEIPDDLDGENSVEDWICGNGLVPTWSERFMSGRIKWEKLDLSPAEIRARKLKRILREIDYHKTQLAYHRKSLAATLLEIDEANKL